MRVVVRTFHHQGSQRIATDRELLLERIRIGRGADQDIQVSDLRAALAHAEILPDRRGASLQASTPNGVWLNGRPVTQERLQRGDRIEIGRFELTVLELLEGERLVLGFEERHTQTAEHSVRKAAFRTRLAHAGLSKRRAAWSLGLLLLLVCIALPLWMRYGQPAEAKVSPQEAAKARSQALFDDSIWATGPSSTAHRFFIEDCGSCHQQPFVRVQNQACLACHQNLPAHSDGNDAAVPIKGADEQCTTCHREHEGSTGLQAGDPQLCQSCHGMPAHAEGTGKPLPASSFASAHPAFAPRVSRFDSATQSFSWTKVREPIAALREDTNLKYPHDLHLNAQGIDSPKGKVVLECADCHQPDASGARFEPVRMETHCAGCHRLDFDPQDPSRLLPHAAPEEIRLMIHDYYAARALQGAGQSSEPQRLDRRRADQPAQAAPPRAAVNPQRWAQAQAQQALEDVFERRTCHYCHQVERTQDPVMPWRITPVLTEERAFDKARFNHAAHQSQSCNSCHTAGTSNTSADVLLPDIGQCRECHGDAQATAAVPSSCSLCHSFHAAEHTRFAQDAAAAGVNHPPVTP